MSYIHIYNGTLIDGTGVEPLQNAHILIQDNQIVDVGSDFDSSKINADEHEILEIDAQGGTILPGLIDTHVHMMFEIAPLQQRITTPFSMNFYKAIHHMRKTLDAGITTVRDAGGTDFGVKQSIEQGLIARSLI